MMRNTILWAIGLSLTFGGAALATTNVIYSDYGDGQVEMRLEWTEAAVQDTGGWEGGIGEWWGGLLSTVIPFQLPDYGPVDNPFDSAGFAVGYHNGSEVTSDVDLYAVDRVDTNSAILGSDYYSGTTPDPTAELIQAGFITSLTPAGYGGSNTVTDAAGGTNLLNYLNSAYDGGSGAGKFVFLRLSLHSDTYGTEYYKVSMRDAGQQAEWPVLTLTSSISDTDEDGLPDLWELANGLDPYDDGYTNINTGTAGDINNGAIGDPDFDSLVNSNEFALGTDPQDDDTDDDGLIDGAEVHTNFTDVLVWDTDGDRLSDGDEVNNIGSNPLTMHSDEDGEDDGLEIWQGTDPTNTLSSSVALGLIIVDGTREAIYGDAVATQTVNTAWEDNLDELDAAYAYVQNDRLFVMITGNMNINWHGVEIFIDSTDAVITNVLETAGNDNTGNMDGLIFDTDFTPDYHLLFRLGDWYGWNFNVDFADLSTKAVSYHLNLFEGKDGGVGYMGAGDATSSAMAIGFTNSNTAGLVQGTGAADESAVLAVETGLEFSVALEDIGNPYGEIRIMVMVTGDDHATASNQILGGLLPPANALGASSNVNFSATSGDQFFGVMSQLLPEPVIIMMEMITGNTQVKLDMAELKTGYDYRIQDSDDLNMGFTDIVGSDFTAAGTNDTVTVSAGVGVDAMFFRVVAP